MNFFQKLIAASTVGVLSLLLISSEPPAPELRIAVAANFLGPAEVLVEAFESATGHRVITSSGSTGKLYAQIVHGAPYDVFLAANAREPRRLEEEGYAVEGSRFTYARGILVLWLPESDRRLTHDEGASGDARTALERAGPERIAIANPLVAPYGAAAVEVLEEWGALHEAGRRIVRGESVAQAYQFAASGNAEASFVALSQVAGSERSPRGRSWRVEDALYRPIRQQSVVLLRAADNPVALAFARYLQSEEARAVIASFGYELE